MSLPPLTFTPILKPRAWGGRMLRSLGKELPDDGAFGESWEIADLPTSIPDGRSIVSEGPYTGQSLHAIIEADPQAILGRAQPGPGGGLPLLVKLLDARENLSVQLHPSPEYAQVNPEAYLKTEAWVVLAADEGATAYVGLHEHVDRTAFEQALKSGQMEPLLVKMPVQAGDCIYLESGLCHALGAGILTAEIQMPSDTTFRVWDWNRDDPDRPLHIREAVESIRLGPDQKTSWPTMTHQQDARTTSSSGVDLTLLVRSPSFTIERFAPSRDANETVSFPFPTNGMPHVFLTAEGEALIEANGESVLLPMGKSLLLPAGAEQAKVHLKVRNNTRASLIHAVPPDPLDNVFA